MLIDIMSFNSITKHLLRIYIDDMNLAVSKVAQGISWEGRPSEVPKLALTQE